jgi:hypothetical protein
MVLWLVKLSVFFTSAYITARAAVKYFRLRNVPAKASDPEILVFASVIGAIITGFVMFIIRLF